MAIGYDAEWPELVGEMTRGGTPNFDTLSPILGGLDPQSAFQVLGEVMQKSPQFAAYINQRAAASRPMLAKIPMQRARDWQIDFGPVSGAAGTTTTLTNNPQCLFRGEKVMATDTATTAGMGTLIQTILIGQRLQRPTGAGGTLTLFFSQQALGNGIRWDTCKEALTIAVTVSFIQAVTFFMTVFGKTLS